MCLTAFGFCKNQNLRNTPINALYPSRKITENNDSALPVFFQKKLDLSEKKIPFLSQLYISELSPDSLPQAAYIHLRAVANYQKTWNRLQQEKIPWDTYTVRAIFDHIFCLGMADLFFKKHPEFLEISQNNTVTDKNSQKENISFLSSPTKHPADIWFLRQTNEMIIRNLENGQIPTERLTPLLKLGREMQFLDIRSPNFGNFRWYYGQKTVEDKNAVEFVLQRVIPLWMEYKNFLSQENKTLLENILQDAAEGCRRHDVPSRYTNIALVNITNLILLGEILNETHLKSEGLRRARRFLLWTWKNGITEYVSPTYYGVNLEALSLLQHYAQNEEAKNFAAAVQKLLWTDISANYFPAAGRLSGSHSRSYNYLYGTDPFSEAYFRKWNWDNSPLTHSSIYFLSAWQSTNKPDQNLYNLSKTFPRKIIQKWHHEASGYRTNYICHDISLGTSSAYYPAAQDMLLAADLPRREHEISKGITRPRFYFIPDGREDPYGKHRIPTLSGHTKALHLSCFWRAAQDEKDAVCLVIYRPKDYQAEFVKNIQSHFVFPLPDEMWVNGKSTSCFHTETLNDSVETLILRYDTAMIGIRLLETRTERGTPARAEIITDAPEKNFMRLTLHHRKAPPSINPLHLHIPFSATHFIHVLTGQNTEKQNVTYLGKNAFSLSTFPHFLQMFTFSSPQASDASFTSSPYAAFHIRIGSNLTQNTTQNAWRENFLHPTTIPNINISPDLVNLAAFTPSGKEVRLKTLQRISFTANFPDETPTQILPPPPMGILHVNGKELGRPILEHHSDFLRQYAEDDDTTSRQKMSPSAP
ncbi:MAG: hypothetical protein Q4C96_07315 [Planctomycetia bacterium]|nr:hypothetical protein [Planctomycetia bacterium]